MSMKRIVLILFLIRIALLSIDAQWSRQNKSEKDILIHFTSTDTMTISYSDNICMVAVHCWDGATDSISIGGYGRVIDGIEPNGILIPPDNSVTIGKGDLPINYLQIIVRDKGNVMLIPCQ